MEFGLEPVVPVMVALVVKPEPVLGKGLQPGFSFRERTFGPIPTP